MRQIKTYIVTEEQLDKMFRTPWLAIIIPNVVLLILSVVMSYCLRK
mgnify:CR=1 FL=1